MSSGPATVVLLCGNPLQGPRKLLAKEKGFFALTVLMLLINFIGWTAYYLGYQYGWLIVISQFMAVPLYYLFYGVWKSNYPMVGTAALFLIFHTINGFMNFVTQ